MTPDEILKSPTAAMIVQPITAEDVMFAARRFGWSKEETDAAMSKYVTLGSKPDSRVEELERKATA